MKKGGKADSGDKFAKGFFGNRATKRTAGRAKHIETRIEKMEGQGLVLIEAMSVGCIPIAYDVPYGPSDIIEHGVNGFLVEAGDISALAERIRQVGTMDAEALVKMRQAAFARAHEFNDEAVVQMWGTAMRDAIERKLWAMPVPTVSRAAN